MVTRSDCEVKPPDMAATFLLKTLNEKLGFAVTVRDVTSCGGGFGGFEFGGDGVTMDRNGLLVECEIRNGEWNSAMNGDGNQEAEN